MNIKDILSDNTSVELPIFKSDNYSNIYKKTEKIACAVFLITDDVQYKEQHKDIVTDIRRYSKETLLAVITLLSSGRQVEGGEALQAVVRHASTLRSLLQILVASRVLRPDLADVLAREIDGVMQNISLIYQEETLARGHGTSDVLPNYIAEERRRPRQLLERTQRPRRSGEASVPRGTTDARSNGSRRESILAVIRQKGQVSIKDISMSVTDCSEKTIQRELMELIKDNLIVKEGERRWSKYSVTGV